MHFVYRFRLLYLLPAAIAFSIDALFSALSFCAIRSASYSSASLKSSLPSTANSASDSVSSSSLSQSLSFDPIIKSSFNASQPAAARAPAADCLLLLLIFLAEEDAFDFASKGATADVLPPPFAALIAAVSLSFSIKLYLLVARVSSPSSSLSFAAADEEALVAAPFWCLAMALKRATIPRVATRLWVRSSCTLSVTFGTCMAVRLSSRFARRFFRNSASSAFSFACAFCNFVTVLESTTALLFSSGGLLASAVVWPRIRDMTSAIACALSIGCCAVSDSSDSSSSSSLS
mmetsp:Transcript_11561/g.17485  ORF Transcript_11561/g.17485 Transcript_11561/m.17485 type:complete len:290 (+) Transcript_11561:1859-2728(+)